MHPKLKELEEAARAAKEQYDGPDEKDWFTVEMLWRNTNEDALFISKTSPDTVLKLVSIIHRFMLFQNGMGIVYHQMTEELNQLGTLSTGSENNENNL